MDPPIIFYLCGMNISCWSRMSDLHQIKTFFQYQNIILCHLGGPHDTLASGWPTCQLSLGWIFLDETQNVAKMRFKPATPLSSEAFTTRLLLWLCWYTCYYFFVLCSGCWFGLVNMKMRVKLATCQVLLLRNESYTPLSSSCTESNWTHLSVLVALTLIFFKAKY
jgi:hypothetical protein